MLTPKVIEITRGSARAPRGFALKLYTEEGNYDLVGNNTPTFFVRYAPKFEDFIHSQKRMPETGSFGSTGEAEA